MTKLMHMYPPVRQIRPHDSVEPWLRGEARAQAARARSARRTARRWRVRH